MITGAASRKRWKEASMSDSVFAVNRHLSQETLCNRLSRKRMNGFNFK
jgi:hypothetical protein